MNDDIERHYKPAVKSRTIDATGLETTTIRFDDQRIWDADKAPRAQPQMNAAQKAVLAYIEKQTAIDLHDLALQVHAAHAELRRAEAAVEELMRKYKDEQNRIHDAADTTLTNLLATSTNLWAVTKTVCDDEERHECVITLAVFKSKKRAEAACLTFAEARAHHDSDVFEVKPLPFFKKCGAA